MEIFGRKLRTKEIVGFVQTTSASVQQQSECKQCLMLAAATELAAKAAPFFNEETDGIKIQYNGEEISIPEDMLAAIHREENIRYARSILSNYIPDVVDELSEDELVEYAEALDDAVLSDNGDIEYDTIESVFGISVFQRQEHAEANISNK